MEIVYAIISYLLVGVIGATITELDNWRHVGYHECKQIDIVEQTGAKVYPLSDGDRHYILYKEGDAEVSCVLPKPK